MAVEIRILIAAASDREAAAFLALLPRGDYVPTWRWVCDEASCREALNGGDWDAIVVYAAGDGAVPSVLRALRERVSGVDPPLLMVAERFEEVAEAAQRLGASVCLRSAGYAHLQPALERALRERGRRRERAARAAFEHGQQAILEQIAAGKALRAILEEIVLLIEHQGTGMLCSILLLDQEAGRVRHGAAPHLPRALVEGVDGAAIGPREGSCGAAAYLGQAVIVEDIGTHPNWAPYRTLALPFGLRACWSSPIFSAPQGEVLGTFAMYYGETRLPTESEREWVARATHLAAIAISRDRAERAIRQAEARYRQIVDTAHEGIWLVDGDGRTLFVNHRTTSLLGHPAADLIGRRIVDFMDPEGRRAAEGSFLEAMPSTTQREFRFQRKDGSLFWALVSGSPIRDDKQHVVGALEMITDISELKRTEEALRKSEAEFRVVFENAATGLALLGEDGRVVRANPALQRFLAYGEAELGALTFSELEHPADRKPGSDFHVTLLKRECEAFRSEKRYLRKNGEVVWGRLTASLAEPSHETPRSVIVMVENVTERRHLEEAVRDSERLRGLMYSAVTDVLFYIGVEPDQQYRFLSVNPAFLKTTGMKEEDVIGRSLAQVIPEPSLAMVRDNYARAIRERRTLSWDEVTQYPAGKKYGEVSITPIFDQTGVCSNLVGTVHDVTERCLAEERVAAQAALLDKANDAILVRSLAGRIEYWNQGAERLYGWSQREALGRELTELVDRDRGAVERAQQLLLSGGVWSGELAQATRAGQQIAVESRWTLLRDEHGQGRSVLVINTDISERKSLQAQVFHTQRLQSMGLLAGGIAHDFNNLLAAILCNAELARQQLERNHRACEPLSEIEKASERAAGLARRLLTFSRQQETARRSVELGALVSEALGLLRPAIPRLIDLTTRLGADAPPIVADATQIHQIVMNLCTNALHALGAGPGTLDVSVERRVLDAPLQAHAATLPKGTYALLTVADSGGGMDDKTLQRIFDPFFTTKGPDQGTGLGLSVVNGIVRSHHGGIVVNSSLGGGTRFSLYFPAEEPAGLPAARA